MYVSMDCLLRHAAEHHYAVMAANALNLEMARGVISAADETQSPLIIILGSMAMAKHSTPELLAPLIQRLAAETAAPIALCLDHGIPIVVFDFFDKNALEGIIKAKPVATIVSRTDWGFGTTDTH